ncbi:MAG: hypothetical protein IPM74_12580 [Crocinitomicaceae bacterium]|nr:hypothetical protein [Crocinitomicaceae bacterium]MBK8926711.1 hypothetical protein [Crocinitomicaceae bacterium]
MEPEDGKKNWKRRGFPERRSQQIFTKNYSDDNVSRLKKLLLNPSQGHGERFYAIKVDGEFCVYRTSNPRSFDDYKEMIDGSTETVEVILYFGQSNNCNRHIFYLKEKSLNGADPIDFDKKIKDALEKNDQAHLIVSLQQKVDDQEELIDELQEELEELRKKTDMTSLLKEGISLLGIFKGKTPEGALAGAPPVPDAEVKVESADEQKKEDTKQKEGYQAFSELYEKFGDKGVNQVVQLLMAISKSDKLREGINKLVKEENEKNPTTG